MKLVVFSGVWEPYSVCGVPGRSETRGARSPSFGLFIQYIQNIIQIPETLKVEVPSYILNRINIFVAVWDSNAYTRLDDEKIRMLFMTLFMAFPVFMFAYPRIHC